MNITNSLILYSFGRGSKRRKCTEHYEINEADSRRKGPDLVEVKTDSGLEWLAGDILANLNDKQS